MVAVPRREHCRLEDAVNAPSMYLTLGKQEGLEAAYVPHTVAGFEQA